jgi:hypothetical protein
VPGQGRCCLDVQAQGLCVSEGLPRSSVAGTEGTAPASLWGPCFPHTLLQGKQAHSGIASGTDGCMFLCISEDLDRRVPRTAEPRQLKHRQQQALLTTGHRCLRVRVSSSRTASLELGQNITHVRATVRLSSWLLETPGSRIRCLRAHRSGETSPRWGVGSRKLGTICYATADSISGMIHDKLVVS